MTTPQSHQLGELLRGQELWHSIAESPFDFVSLVDAAGTYLYINHTELGFRAEDLVGKATLSDYLAPDDHPRVREALHSVFELARPAYYEARVPANDRWYATMITPIRREGRVIAASVLSRDCTAQKRALSASREATELYRVIVESTRDGIWLLDVRGITLFVNARLAAMLGYSPEEMQGRSFLEFMDSVRRMQASQNLSRRLQGQQELHDFCFRRKDGSDLWTLVSASPTYDAQGALSGALAIITDQTERRRWADEVARAQKMDAVGHLAGGIAHEFNNLLASIVGFGSVLERSLQGQEKAVADVGHILQAADRASGLVRQLLSFARKQDVRPSVIDMTEVLEALRPMLQSLLPDDVDLSIELASCPCRVRVDPAQMEQVLLNLVINARDAIAEKGRVRIRVEREPCDEGTRGGDEVATVTSWRGCPHITVKVTDDGSGIPASVLEHIFEPFFTTKDADRGTGLGLSIVFSIVQQAGGDLSVTSDLGRGTEFCLRFPEAAEARAGQPVDTHQELVGGTETVLLVEDDASVRASTQRMLTALGYRVVAASNGEEALKLVEAHESPGTDAAVTNEPFAVVISDVVMPKLSGPDLIERMRRRHPELRVLFLSGHSEGMRSGRGLRSSYRLLDKPFSLMHLARVLREVLDGSDLS
jgi:two-component system cell cycle sensor histidine kinase/response regulator CckA